MFTSKWNNRIQQWNKVYQSLAWNGTCGTEQGVRDTEWVQRGCCRWTCWISLWHRWEILISFNATSSDSWMLRSSIREIPMKSDIDRKTTKIQQSTGRWCTGSSWNTVHTDAIKVLGLHESWCTNNWSYYKSVTCHNGWKWRVTWSKRKTRNPRHETWTMKNLRLGNTIRDEHTIQQQAEEHTG